MPIPKNYSGSGKNCCVYSKGSYRTAGLGRIFNKARPSPLDNKYVVGSGVGAQSIFVKRALKRRANNKANGMPCCAPAPPSWAPAPLSWATARTMSEYAYLYATLGYIDISTAGGNEFFKQKLLDASPHHANLTTPIIVLSGGLRYNVHVNAFLPATFLGSSASVEVPIDIDKADSFLRTNNPTPTALQYNFDTPLLSGWLEAPAMWAGYLLTHPPNPSTANTFPESGFIIFVRAPPSP